MTVNRNPRSRFPLPDVINPPNRRCVTLNIPDNLIHIGNFWGAIQKLGSAASYSDDEAHTALLVADVWRQVIQDARERWLEAECGGALEEGDCIAHDTASGIITWAPHNPYTQPDEVPTGYQFPPLYVVKSTDLALLTLGFAPGDVQTDLLDFPPGSLPTVIPPGGLPRFRVNFNGTDDPFGITVELHLVKIVAGGYALITVDNDPLTVELVSLHRDDLAVPPETNVIVTIEKQVLGTGAHFVDCTFVPRVNDELPFLFFGGGLHKVVLCGKDVSVPVPQMTFDGCVLRFRASTSSPWQEFDLSNCVRSVVDEEIAERLEDGTLRGGQNPPGGTLEASFCKTFQATLDANGKWRLPIPIKAEYTITVRDARGGASGGTPSWYCPSGAGYVLGACNMAFAHTEGSDPMPAQNHMRLIMQYNSTFFDAYNVEHNVSTSLVGEHDVTFQVNDSALADNAGSYQFEVEVCNDQQFGLYTPDTGSNASITLIGPNKWHVAFDEEFDGAPGFYNYGNAMLQYGRISPAPQTAQCVTWLITNFVGYVDDPGHDPFTTNTEECPDALNMVNHTNPATQTGKCKQRLYVRNPQAFSFDVEIVDPCQ